MKNLIVKTKKQVSELAELISEEISSLEIEHRDLGCSDFKQLHYDVRFMNGSIRISFGRMSKAANEVISKMEICGVDFSFADAAAYNFEDLEIRSELSIKKLLKASQILAKIDKHRLVNEIWQEIIK